MGHRQRQVNCGQARELYAGANTSIVDEETITLITLAISYDQHNHQKTKTGDVLRPSDTTGGVDSEGR